MRRGFLFAAALLLILCMGQTAYAAKVKSPTGLKADYDKNYVKLTWKKVSKAKGYVVYRYSSTAGPYIRLGAKQRKRTATVCQDFLPGRFIVLRCGLTAGQKAEFIIANTAKESSSGQRRSRRKRFQRLRNICKLQYSLSERRFTCGEADGAWTGWAAVRKRERWESAKTGQSFLMPRQRIIIFIIPSISGMTGWTALVMWAGRSTI